MSSVDVGMLTANLWLSASRGVFEGGVNTYSEPLDARQFEQWQSVTLLGSDVRGRETTILPQLQAP